jgi:hypothetical protein
MRPRPRQTLTMPQVFPPTKEQIIQTALFVPCRFFLIDAELPITHTFERLPGPPGPLKGLALLLAHLLQPGELLLKFSAMAQQGRIALQFESQLGRRGARAQFLKLLGVELFPAPVQMLDHMPHPCYPLVGGTQPQFLLVLDAFAKMQYGLKREMESHVLRVRPQLGKASNLLMVSPSGAASPGFCIRN